MMAARTAGRLGEGGGPGFFCAWRTVFFPLRFGEAAGLEEEEGDHGHQGVAMQCLP
jgi:hypothetical protein